MNSHEEKAAKSMKRLLTILLFLPLASNAQQLHDSAFNARLNQCGKRFRSASGMRTGSDILGTIGVVVIGASCLPENAKGAKNGVFAGSGIVIAALALHIVANNLENKAGLLLQVASGHLSIPIRSYKHQLN